MCVCVCVCALVYDRHIVEVDHFVFLHHGQPGRHSDNRGRLRTVSPCQSTSKLLMDMFDTYSTHILIIVPVPILKKKMGYRG